MVEVGCLDRWTRPETSFVSVQFWLFACIRFHNLPRVTSSLCSECHPEMKREDIFLFTVFRWWAEMASHKCTKTNILRVISSSLFPWKRRLSFNFWFLSGAPHHIELKSQAFDDSSKQNQEHTARFFSNCYLSASIFAHVCDRSRNKTPLKTTLNLSWIPGSCGLQLSKKTTQKGEVVFEASTMRCGSRSGDQQVKLRVSSSEHKSLQVRLL